MSHLEGGGTRTQGRAMTLLNLLQLRLGVWIVRTAMERMDRGQRGGSPRSLPPFVGRAALR